MGSGFRRRCAVFLAAVAALFLAAPALAGGRLAEADIERTFSGITLDGVYAEGTFFSETYNTDGTIRYHDPDGADSGEWSVRDGMFCTFYENAQGSCFFVERDGANCFTFYAPQGSGAEAKPAATWTSRGWNRDLPPTCPNAPEIQL